MKQKNPAILFYFDNWTGGTITLSRHLKGCYMDLLSAQFNSGHLSVEEIKTVLGSDFSAWNTLQKKFDQDSNGLFFSRRMDAEIEKRKAFVEKTEDFSDKQRDRVNKRYQNSTAVDTSKNEIEIKVENGIENGIGIGTKADQFELFWKMYDKGQNRFACEKLWVLISYEDRLKILEKTPNYVLSTPEKAYRLNPENYLVERWKDEIIIKQQKNNNGNGFTKKGSANTDAELTDALQRHLDKQ